MTSYSETKPQSSISASDQSIYPEPFPSSIADDIDEQIPSKHLL
jgi:hypothetical protein